MGTTPGDPLGCILYIFVMSRMFQALEQEFTAQGLLDTVPYAEHAALLEQSPATTSLSISFTSTSASDRSMAA